MTRAMQTKPEQWAVELWNRAADTADGCATQSFGDDAKAAALTIQRAFEDQTRKLREALEQIANVARSPATMQQIARAALKEEDSQ